jgi:putative endonuclease
MHIVYVIQHDIDKSVYIGITHNLRQRLSQHNAGENKSTIRKIGKWKLVYAEAYRDKKDAVIREFRLKKHGSGKHELYKRLKNSMF